MFGSKSEEISELQKQNSDLTAQNKTLSERVTALATEKETAEQAAASEKARADKAEADLKTAQEAATAAQTKFDADLKAAQDKHAADLKAAQEAHEKKVNDEVTTRLASAGGDPLPKDPSAKGQGDPGQPDTSGLKGMAKARALIAAKQKAN